MSESVASPQFRVLTRRECESLLARSSVGRVAFVRGNRVDIIPLNYVFDGSAICGRTARGTRLEETCGNFHDSWPVAFEVDEVEGLFEWRSVVVHGNLHAAAEGGGEWRRDPRAWDETIRSFRTLIPQAFTQDDPTGFRDVLIRIDVAEVSGREALPRLRRR